MTFQTSPPPHAATTDGGAPSEDGGFILVTLGLLIIPIMVFAALSVDVSAWYTRASELQRAADSASLAGVVWMPELGTAQGRATDTLNRNGVVSGSDDITVTINPGTEANSLRVCITDNSAPQYFAAVFASPTSITRCATAQFNIPLQLGSPLNYFGGNTNLAAYQPGPVPGNAAAAVPSYNDFRQGWTYQRYCRVPAGGGNPAGYWDRNSNSTNPSNWIFRFGTITGSFNDCGAPTAQPDVGSFEGGNYCRVVVGGNYVAYWYRGSNPWRYYNFASTNWTIRNSPECGYGGTNRQPIPAEKSPGMWAAVLGPNNGKHNGDIYSTYDGLYRSTGYWYSIDIPDSGVVGPVSVQVFDANTNCDVGCRTPMGDDSGPSMYYAVLDGGTTPYDMSDDVQLCEQSIPNGSNSTYSVRWWELCRINSPIPGRRYYVNVRSTGGSNYNGYAMRAVAGSYPAACLDRMPEANVNCYGAPGSVQPALSAYGDMEMYNGIAAGVPTKFFLANVKKVYAGKTLRIRLWDPGDGNGDITVQILKPGSPSNSPEQGVPVPSCTWTRTNSTGALQTTPGLGVSGGTLNGSDGCKITTTNNSTMYFQDRWIDFRIDIPDDYTCDDTRDPLQMSGSCWWQIRYETSQSTSDYTTWSAEIIGDPVRLTQ